MSRRLTSKRAITAASLALIGLLMAAGLALFVASGLGLSALTPEQRWAARSFDHYQLTYHISGHIGCQAEVEVRAETVVDASFAADYGGYCPLMSVTGLFRRIEKIRQDTPCGPNGCGCDGPVEVRAEFDQTLGYPTLIEQTLRPDLRWRYFDYWVHNRVGGGCTLMGYTDSRIDVDAPVILP